MTISYVLLQNLKRNPLRSVLTVAAFALPMAVFVGAISLVIALIELNKLNAQQLRLGVQNRIALVNTLPERVRPEIESLDADHTRLTAICGLRWFGGRVPNKPSVVQSLGADVDTFPIVYSDLEWTEEEKANFAKDRRSCVVGSNVADQYGWKLGQRITLESTVPPYLSLEFIIVKVVNRPGRTNALYLRRDYFEEARRTAGYDNPGCNVFWLKCANAEALHSLQHDIDTHFANTPNETKSLDENAFAAQFVQGSGDLPGLMRQMAIVVLFIVALVAGNTMMMSFRERTREFAVFKAMGFPHARVARIVLAESLTLALLGAVVGIVPMTLLLAWIPMNRMGFLPIASLRISPVAIVASLVVSILVGLAAGAWPAYQALRLRTVEALRTVA